MRLKGVIVIICWLSIGYMLWPLPPQKISELSHYLDHKSESIGKHNTGEWMYGETERFLDRRHAEVEKNKIWGSWAFTFFAIILGIISGWLYLIGRKVGVWLIIGTSAGYFLFIAGKFLSIAQNFNVNIIDAYIAYVRVTLIEAEGSSVKLMLVHMDILLPIVFFAVLCITLIETLRAGGQRSKRGR